jgi:catecholate siderophore receptor
MTSRPVRHGALLAFLAIGTLARPLSAQDRSAPSPAVAGSDTVARAFRIAPQPLPSALEEFARQSALRVRVDTDVPAVRSPGVVGMLTPAEALRRLTMGTGLIAQMVDEKTVAVRLENSGAYVLDPVEVVAARPARTITATATKTPTPLVDVPQSVTVIGKTLIEDQGMRSMADVTRYVPGITMGQGEGNRDQPTIRGNATTASFFVDGVRDDVQYFRDLYNVERVEALKGANALIFGRGTGGGVLNRVTKEAQWNPVRELSVEGGSYGTRRGALDLGQGISETVALRFNGMYENSDRFRHDVNIERYGFNPAVKVAAGANTRISANFEHFSDYRTADRGVPSFQGRPAATDARTFFGDPSRSWADADVSVGTAAIEHDLAPAVQLRNRTVLGDYNKMYQNIYPGAIDSTGALVSLSAYNNRNDRNNLFNQTELTWRVATGSVSHVLLGGVELGHQITRNLRNTGLFDGTDTTVTAPVTNPTISRPVTFSPAATDANNRTRANTIGVYLQDQVTIARQLQLIAGARFERFDLAYHNFRDGQDLDRQDHLVSPRAGVVVKPIEPLSFYGSYSVSYLPSSGDQFSSLTATSQTLEPEKFENYEAGAKLDILTGLSLSAAVYRLDRTNTTAPDPIDPSRTVQTGSQRTKGFEFGATGNVTSKWQVAAAYANQDAYVTSETLQAEPGAKVPLVPRNSFSLWNKYQPHRKWGVGAGIIYQDEMFAAIDNAVTLPSFTRFDAALFYTLSPELRAQVNIENLFDKEYFITSHSNNNISPGSPRAVRVSLTAGF